MHETVDFQTRLKTKPINEKTQPVPRFLWRYRFHAAALQRTVRWHHYRT